MLLAVITKNEKSRNGISDVYARRQFRNKSENSKHKERRFKII
jgi:hypothetical protein